MISKSHCPYCTKAKATLSKLLSADKMQVIEIDGMPNMDDIQNACQYVFEFLKPAL